MVHIHVYTWLQVTVHACIHMQCMSAYVHNALFNYVGHQSLTSGMQLRKNILVSGNADSNVKVNFIHVQIRTCITSKYNIL